MTLSLAKVPANIIGWMDTFEVGTGVVSLMWDNALSSDALNELNKHKDCLRTRRNYSIIWGAHLVHEPRPALPRALRVRRGDEAPGPGALRRMVTKANGRLGRPQGKGFVSPNDAS